MSNKVTQLTVITRLFKDRRGAGYKVIDSQGKTYNYTKDQVWDIARHKGFTNVRAAINNGDKLLRGVGKKLVDLTTINI